MRLSRENQIQLERFQGAEALIDFKPGISGKKTCQDVAVMEKCIGVPVPPAVIKLNAVRHERGKIRESGNGIGKIRKRFSRFQTFFRKGFHF